jgi:hypothetical protein
MINWFIFSTYIFFHNLLLGSPKLTPKHNQITHQTEKAENVKVGLHAVWVNFVLICMQVKNSDMTQSLKKQKFDVWFDYV